MKRLYTADEIDEAAKEFLDDPEKYALWVEHRDEYLEYRRELKKMCEEDKQLVESVVMQLQSTLNEMHDTLEKPGWDALPIEKEIRNFQCEFLDGTFVPNPECVQSYPPMSDREMAKATGLSRERVVQETKRISRKVGQKLKMAKIDSADFQVNRISLEGY